MAYDSAYHALRRTGRERHDCYHDNPRTGLLSSDPSPLQTTTIHFMQIKLSSLTVTDQEKALHFYTTVLGFTKQADVSMGAFRWLTVSSPDGVPGVELVLEPLGFPPAAVFQKARFDAGLPATAFFTTDIAAEVQRLKAAGVRFRGEPTTMGPITAVVFDDTCGNLINLVQPAT